MGKQIVQQKTDTSVSSQGHHAFTAQIMRLLLEGEKANFAFSPTGLSNILLMLQEGTTLDGEVHRNIRRLLGDATFYTPQSHNKAFVIKQASSLWLNEGIKKINSEYVERLHTRYDSEVRPADFSSATITSEIDQWVKEKTSGVIPALGLKVDPLTLLILLDALYLKGTWRDTFDPEDTYDEVFISMDKTKASVPTMHQYFHRIRYKETTDYQSITMPYVGWEYAMTVVLPREISNLDNLMLKDEWLDTEYIDGEVDYSMPRFEVENSLEVQDVLRQLGLSALFDREDALPRITDAEAHVSKILQRCKVTVDEAGTEAAAVTCAICELGCPPPGFQSQVYHMHVDRPFGYTITDEAGNVIFMGVIKQLK